MKNRRIVPLAIAAVAVVSLALAGFPWPSPSMLANFSGVMVYTAGEGDLEFQGQINFFSTPVQTKDLALTVCCGGREHRLNLNSSGTFTGRLEGAGVPATSVLARLEAGGQVVAQGQIVLPAGQDPTVHIIRFTSAS